LDRAEGSGDRERAMTSEMAGLRRHWVIAEVPMKPEPPVMMIFIVVLEKRRGG